VAGDDVVRFGTIENLLHQGTLNPLKFSLAMPLVSAPFLLLGEVVRSPQWWAGRFNVIFLAAGVAAAFWMLRGRVDAVLLRRFALLLMFASFMTDRLRGYDAEVLTAELAALGIVALLTGRRFAGWTMLVIAAVNTPAATLPLALVAAAETARTKRLRNLLAIGAAIALIMVEDWVRRGGPLRTGYTNDHGVVTFLPYSGRPGFSYPFLLGVLSILFAFGRGIVFYMPGIVLWFGERTRRVARDYRYAVWLMLLFVVGLVLAYAKWWAWYGGTSWGPRFFLFAAIPSSFLIALRLRRAGESPLADTVTLFFLAFSGWVGVAGAIDNHGIFSFCFQNNYSLESACWYTPEFSTLWHPLVEFTPLTWKLSIVAAYCALVFAYLATPPAAALVRTARAARIPPAWREDWRL
jgi:hypothetical protein